MYLKLQSTDIEYNYNPHINRKATFRKDEDEEMVAYITLMAKKFYGSTQQQLHKLTYGLKNIRNIFSSEI